ncbi:hypothetical protein ABB37_01536 [Leptomonas pyrrhocoris]|uniref:DUF676 domain-containing protein n=1 Tax=Leptomonas pyrrhocoris TaxID=157538 RepID=A0A0N0VHD1_LEPPY|nr:hypothetical protein ABB37_01536 [Leptomonas pyrrhocoris]XP_015663600.1 hypothetical protein ABB37_01536 [Leptomonas pyrrhocoris]KPA85160.1 hypothetical protein ABB37_01536 [Leptomonas pyrrhocoris]KPA85161.1 hypothetical protein ABB37_01536 [Leptomonas pyrrhocoris]|eukprot:XP_015663599.1 hypothetical protein ABB37_01536 [Leptomonas pyrrhocoris]
MESRASAATPAEDFVCLHFVFLHHGYHGRETDFHYLSSTAESALRAAHGDDAPASQPASPHFVFIHPSGSSFLRREQGVVAYAQRYSNHACAVISETLSPFSRERNRGVDHDDKSGRGTAAGSAARGAPVELHFSAVGHSMGGLILRFAFPLIMRWVEQLVSQSPWVRGVHWDTFCTMATPHLGVLYVGSHVKTFLGKMAGSLLSAAVADLFSQSTLITLDLVTEESLAAWARFKRRVILNVVDDRIVVVCSSSFVMPLDVRQRISAAVPSPPPASSSHAAPAVLNSTDESKQSVVAGAVRGPSHGKEHSGPEKRTCFDVPNTDASVMHLAEFGVYCASTVEGLRRNAYELKKLSDELWPPELLPQQRALAERILGRVGPLELHLLDFRPLRDAPVECLPRHVAEARAKLGVCSSAMMALGAHNFSHAAMACKGLFNYPAFFGFPSEYIVTDLLGIPLTVHGLSTDAKDASTSL